MDHIESIVYGNNHIISTLYDLGIDVLVYVKDGIANPYDKIETNFDEIVRDSVKFKKLATIIMDGSSQCVEDVFRFFKRLYLFYPYKRLSLIGSNKNDYLKILGRSKHCFREWIDRNVRFHKIVDDSLHHCMILEDKDGWLPIQWRQKFSIETCVKDCVKTRIYIKQSLLTLVCFMMFLSGIKTGKLNQYPEIIKFMDRIYYHDIEPLIEEKTYYHKWKTIVGDTIIDTFRITTNGITELNTNIYWIIQKDPSPELALAVASIFRYYTPFGTSKDNDVCNGKLCVEGENYIFKVDSCITKNIINTKFLNILPFVEDHFIEMVEDRYTALFQTNPIDMIKPILLEQ